MGGWKEREGGGSPMRSTWTVWNRPWASGPSSRLELTVTTPCRRPRPVGANPSASQRHNRTRSAARRRVVRPAVQRRRGHIHVDTYIHTIYKLWSLSARRDARHSLRLRAAVRAVRSTAAPNWRIDIYRYIYFDIYMYRYISLSISVLISINLSTSLPIYTCIHIWIYRCMYICMYIYVCMYVLYI